MAIKIFNAASTIQYHLSYILLIDITIYLQNKHENQSWSRWILWVEEEEKGVILIWKIVEQQISLSYFKHWQVGQTQKYNKLYGSSLISVTNLVSNNVVQNVVTCSKILST